jgi:hypothetical protein
VLRHGGEAAAARRAFVERDADDRARLLAFLESLILFPPENTASNLDPGDPRTPGYPQFGHGSIRLAALFNDPNERE